MMEGRFLGIAQNVGDAFCYLILTQPEDESDGETPQVLARSVIRRRYVREESPVVEVDDDTNSLIFYKSDGVTPLDVPDNDAEETEPLEDVLLTKEEIRKLRANLQSKHPIGSDPEDKFETGIYEVYGPVTKRPRLSDPIPSGKTQPAEPESISQHVSVALVDPPVSAANSNDASQRSS